MIRYLVTGVAGSLLTLSAPAFAASPWDGTWKADLKAAQYDPKPDIWTLKGGVYDCATCTPALKIAADGKVHPVTGRDYADAMSVTIVNPSTVKVASYKKGAIYAETERTVSADGKTLTTNWRNSLNPTGEWKSGTMMMTRTGPAAAGAHAFSGKWVPIVSDATRVPEENLTVTTRVDGDIYTMKAGSGESYTARFGGPKVAIVGDKTGAMVAIRRVSDTELEQTFYVKDKAVSVDTITMTDPQTVVVNSHDLRAGFNDKTTLRKQ